MKTLANILLTTLIMVGTVLAAEASLTKEAVSLIGTIILRDKSNSHYDEGFKLETPEFDKEEGIWRFQATGKFFPVTLGAPLYFFEIRDKDGYYRIGSISGRGFSPKSAERFRMPPALRKKITGVVGK